MRPHAVIGDPGNSRGLAHVWRQEGFFCRELPHVWGGGGKFRTELPHAWREGGKFRTELPHAWREGGSFQTELPHRWREGGDFRAELPHAWRGGRSVPAKLVRPVRQVAASWRRRRPPCAAPVQVGLAKIDSPRRLIRRCESVRVSGASVRAESMSWIRAATMPFSE